MPVDLQDFYNRNKSYFGDKPLADVAQEAYQKSGAADTHTYDQWLDWTGTGRQQIEQDTLRREAKKPGSLIRRAVADPAVSLAKGTVGLGDALVGAADLISGGYAGKTLEDLGYDSQKVTQGLEKLYSPQQRMTNQGLAETKGFLPSLEYAVKNPSTIVHSILGSAPSMYAGGAVARGLIGVAPRAMEAAGGMVGKLIGVGAEQATPILAGSIGEGAVQATQAAEQARQESPDKLLSAKQAALTAGSGIIDALIVLGSGKIANKFGISDIENLMAGGKTGSAIDSATGKEIKKGLARKTAESMVNEGLLQELPQSAQEQILQNLASDKPWDEGVGQASVMGLLTGAAMGGGATAYDAASMRGSHGKADGDTNLSVEEQAANNGPSPQDAISNQQRQSALGKKDTGDKFKDAGDIPVSGEVLQPPISNPSGIEPLGNISAPVPVSPAGPITAALNMAPGFPAGQLSGEQSGPAQEFQPVGQPSTAEQAAQVLAGKQTPAIDSAFAMQAAGVDSPYYPGLDTVQGGAPTEIRPRDIKELSLEDLQKARPAFEQRNRPDILQMIDAEILNKTNKVPDHLRQIFGIMRDEANAGGVESLKDTSEGGKMDATTGVGRASSHAEWFRDLNREIKDRLPEIGGIDKKTFDNLLTKKETGQSLTDRQDIIWKAMETAAESYSGRHPDTLISQEESRIKKMGFEPNHGQEIKLTSLAPGDKVLFGDEEFHFKGFDDQGQIVFKDGEPIHVDPFESITPDGIKRTQQPSKAETFPAERQSSGNLQNLVYPRQDVLAEDPGMQRMDQESRGTRGLDPIIQAKVDALTPESSPADIRQVAKLLSIPAIGRDVQGRARTPGVLMEEIQAKAGQLNTESPQTGTEQRASESTAPPTKPPIYANIAGGDSGMKTGAPAPGSSEVVGAGELKTIAEAKLFKSKAPGIKVGMPVENGNSTGRIYFDENKKPRVRMADGRSVKWSEDWTEPGVRAEPAQRTSSEAPGAEKAGGGIQAEKTNTQDRRSDTATRKFVSEMTPEEMHKELMTDYLTGLGNKRAYDESEKKAVQGSIDVDSLKWVNDNIGHDAGDTLLKLIGDSLNGHPDAYHVSGDEFMVQGDSQAEIDSIIQKAHEYLDNNELIYADANGTVHTLKGSFSYGTGRSIAAEDKQLQESKSAREISGDRAGRGEKPPGYRQGESGGQALGAGEPGEQDLKPIKDTIGRLLKEKNKEGSSFSHRTAMADVEDEILFKDASKPPAENRIGKVTAERARSEFKDITDRLKENGINLVFHDKAFDIEDPRMKSAVTDHESATGRSVTGFYEKQSKTIGIITGQSLNMNSIKRDLVHEIAHHGLYESMGKDLNPFLDFVANHPKYGEQIKETAEAREIDTSTESGRRQAAKDWFSDAAAAGKIAPSLWSRFVVAFKKALVRLGFRNEWVVRFDDKDLAETIKSAMKAAYGEVTNRTNPESVSGTDYKTTGHNAPEGIINRLDKIHPGIDSHLIFEKDGTINLSRIKMPESLRGKGLGSRYMNELTGYADDHGMTITLAAKGDFGGDVQRQKNFYMLHGFETYRAEGSNDNMVRYPSWEAPDFSDKKIHVDSRKAESDKFAESLDKWENGTLRKRSPVHVGKTPDVLVRLGAKPLDLTITTSAIEKIVNPKGIGKGKHGIPIGILKQIPDQIKNPIMVFDSTSNDGDKKSFVVMTELTQAEGGELKTIVVAIHLSKSGETNVVNEIASIHPRGNDSHFTNWIRDGLLRYANKGKSLAWFRTRGLQLPKAETHEGFNKRVLTEDDFVKKDKKETATASAPEDYRIDFSDKRITGDEAPIHDYLKARETAKEKEGTAKWRAPAADVTQMDLIFGQMLYSAKKVPALKKMFDAAGNYLDSKTGKQRELLYSPDGKIAYPKELERIEREHKDQFRTLGKYLVTLDMAAKGYKVKAKDERTEGGGVLKTFILVSPKEGWKEGTFSTEAEAWKAAIEYEAEAYAKFHPSAHPDIIKALTTFRTIGHNMYDMLYQSMENMIEAYEKAGQPMPEFSFEDASTGKKVRMTLKKAMAEMGDIRGSYFPRTREPGSFTLIAKKEGANPILEKFDIALTYKNEDSWRSKIPIPINRRAAELKKQGYDVSMMKSDALPESVFLELSGQSIALESLLTQAFDKLNANQEHSLKDMGIHSKWDGKDFVIYGEGIHAKSHPAILQHLGGEYQYVQKKGQEGYPSIRFKDAKETIAEDVKDTLLKHAQSSFVDTMFGNNLITTLADIFKSRGGRSGMVSRHKGVGVEVWKGYEENPTLAFTRAALGIAGATAKGELAKQLHGIITGRTESWAEYQQRIIDTTPATMASYAEYQKEVEARKISATKQPNAYKLAQSYTQNMLRNDEAPDRIVGVAGGLAVLKYLWGRPGAVFVNLTNMAAGVPGSMTGHAGIPMGKTFGLIGKAGLAYKDYKFGGGKSLDKWTLGALEHIEKNGWDQAQYNQEAMAPLKGKFGRAFEKVMEYGMLGFSVSEKINRVSTILGTYMGIKEMHKGLWTEAAHQDALEKAKEVSDKAHGVYGDVNRVYLAQGGGVAGNLAKSFFMFKTFSHNYVLNMIELGFKKEIKAMTYLALAPAIMAGASAGVGFPIIKAIASALGVDDPEEEFYSWIEKEMGSGSMMYARTGLLGLGGDGPALKGSLSIGMLDLPTSVADLLGAPAGIAKDLVDGAKAIGRGDLVKGAEKVLPNSMAGPIRAYRESTEGMTTAGNAPRFFGDKQVKLTGFEAAMRTLSFNPARVAVIQDIQRGEFKAKEMLTKQRTEIYNRARRAILNQDQDEYADVLARMNRYNLAVKGNERYEGYPLLTWKKIIQNARKAQKPSKSERNRQVEL